MVVYGRCDVTNHAIFFDHPVTGYTSRLHFTNLGFKGASFEIYALFWAGSCTSRHLLPKIIQIRILGYVMCDITSSMKSMASKVC